MAGKLLLLALCLCPLSCSYVSDPYEGIIVDGPAAYHLGNLPQYNQAAYFGGPLTILNGADNRLWLALDESGGFHVKQLDAPFAEESYPAADVSGNLLYIYGTPSTIDDTTYQTSLTIRAPGDTGAGRVFELPSYSPFVIEASNNQAFAYVHDDGLAYDLIRVDGSFQRTIPMDGPHEVYGDTSLDFDSRFYGNEFFTRGESQELIAHFSTEVRDVSLGYLPSDVIFFDELHPQVVLCGPSGLRAISLVDFTTETVLDAASCVLFNDAIQYVDGFIYYDAIDEYSVERRRVPFDGASAPVVDVPEMTKTRILQVGPAQTFVYSTTPQDFYASDATDGWLGDWNFMTRGLQVRWSANGEKLYWIENAATDNGTGYLRAAAIATHDSRTLARNVAQFAELADGRILAIDNADVDGPQRRLILIDEATGHGRLLGTGALSFTLVPGENEVLAEIPDINLDQVIVRVPIPPK